MTDSPNTEREETEETEETEEIEGEDVTLLGHDPVLGPSDPEADEHGDNLTRVDEDQLG